MTFLNEYKLKKKQIEKYQKLKSDKNCLQVKNIFLQQIYFSFSFQANGRYEPNTLQIITKRDKFNPVNKQWAKSKSYFTSAMECFMEEEELASLEAFLAPNRAVQKVYE